MVKNRPGITKLGCLMIVLLFVAVAHWGIPVGEAYYRYLRYKDAMKQELRFRADLPNDQLKARFKMIADSLGLPEDAGIVTITREDRVITVESHYEETVDLPLTKRDIHFEPRAVGNY